MTVITLRKTIPTSSAFYTGTGGDTTITFNTATDMTFNSKKSLTKYTKNKTKNSQNTSVTDQADNQVIDLKRIDQTIKMGGWLEDDATQTAWNKFWKLWSMQSRGGPLTSLSIGTAVPLVFPSSTPAVYPTTTPQAFIENLTGQVQADDTGDITATNSASSQAIKPVRIKIDFDVYLGYER